MKTILALIAFTFAFAAMPAVEANHQPCRFNVPVPEDCVKRHNDALPEKPDHGGGDGDNGDSGDDGDDGDDE